MAEKSVKCYGMQIDAAEIFLNLPSGKWTTFLDEVKPLGVFQDPAGQLQIIIFLSKEDAKAAVDKAQVMKMVSAALWPTMIYVTEDDLQIDLESFGDLVEESEEQLDASIDSSDI